jgi:hypothetical protein
MVSSRAKLFRYEKWLFGNSRGEHQNFAVTCSSDHQKRDSTTRIPKEPEKLQKSRIQRTRENSKYQNSFVPILIFWLIAGWQPEPQVWVRFPKLRSNSSLPSTAPITKIL